VMYRGKVVEQGPTEDLFCGPVHPYTNALLDAIPVNNPRDRRHRTFLNAEQIDAKTPRYTPSQLPKKYTHSAQPQLVALTDDHFVEATVIPEGGKLDV